MSGLYCMSLWKPWVGINVKITILALFIQYNNLFIALFVYVCVCVCVCVCLCVYVYVCMCLFVHVCVFVCVSVYSIYCLIKCELFKRKTVISMEDDRLSPLHGCLPEVLLDVSPDSNPLSLCTRSDDQREKRPALMPSHSPIRLPHWPCSSDLT